MNPKEISFEQAFDHSFSPTAILDSTFAIKYINPIFGSFLKLPPRKITDQKIYELLPLEKKLWKDLVASAREKAIAVTPEFDFVYQDSVYSFVLRLVCHSEDRFILYGNDLSVEKLLHQKYRDQVELLRQDHRQVVQEDKVRTIGELTAGISHEINNPLTVASGNAEVLGFLLEEDNLEEQREEIGHCIGNVNEALERIGAIILGMKGFLHQDSGFQDKKKYLGLEGVIANALKLTQATYDSADVELKVSNELPNAVVLGDQTRLEQVLINLLQNALDSVVSAETESGKVTIRLYKAKGEGDDQIFLSVLDNGEGVSDKDRIKIFETFYTTKEVGEGTGLGLSICQKIAEDHQGNLECLESTKGAHFRLSLPVIEVSSFANNDEILQRINDIDGKKVLIVDNDVTILNLCQTFLEGSKYTFIGSTGGLQALDVLEKYDIDVVITDLQMPELSGRDFVKKLRQKDDKVAIFYSSAATGMESYQEDKLEHDLSGMLVKPYKQEELLSLLNSIFVKGEN